MNRICYRIYTENTENKDEEKGVAAIVATKFTAFTVYYGIGYWKSQQERSTVIEIIDSIAARDNILTIAGEIKTFLKQEAVLVTYAPAMATLV